VSDTCNRARILLNRRRVCRPMHTRQACDKSVVQLTELWALLPDNVPHLAPILSRKDHPRITAVRDARDGLKQLLLAELGR